MDKSTEAAGDPDQTGFQVDDLIVDIGQQRVTRTGVEIPMPHLSFDLLVTLARAAPNLVTFDQLIERVWPGLIITSETISQRVKLVRTALGDDPHAPRYIAGVRGRGYRMVANVRPLTERRRGEPVTPYWVADPAPTGAAATGAHAAVSPAAMPDTAAGARPGLLAWVGGALAVVALLALPWGATHWLRGSRAAQSGTVVVQPPHTIAVLPLVDVTPGDGNTYLGDGLAQELSTRLARIHGLRVASRTSAFAFKDREADVRTIAQTLGVRHVLEGSVMRQGNQLRVTAQLVDASSGYNVWSQTYNRTWQDLVAIQDEIARSIVGTLQVVLTNDQGAQPPTTHVDAFDLYLAGLAKLQGPGRAKQLEAAADSFRQALALDPKFALAYAGLCERYIVDYESSRDAALVPQAETNCSAALKLDASLREVSAALAHLYLISGRTAQAETLYREAIRSDPEDADGYMGLGAALDGEQHSAEAESALRRAVDVEPTYWGAQTALGNFLFSHGRASAAVPYYRRVTELIPASPFAFNNLGAALEMTADFSAAAAAYERSLALEPTRSAYSNLGTVYYFLGRYADAARVSGRATELAAEDHRVWGNLADALWQISTSRAEARSDYRRASALAHRSLGVNPKDGLTWMQLAYYSARAGDSALVAGFAQRALELDADDEYVHYYAALVALERGDAGAALDALGRAVELGYPPQLIRAAPDFASLRNDARFRKLIGSAEKSPPA